MLDTCLGEVGRFARQQFPAVGLMRAESFVVAAAGRGAKVYDVSRPGSPAVSSYEGHSLPVTSAEVGTESRWIFTASEDKTLKIWDFRCTGYQVSLGCTAPVLAATMHGNGAEIFYGDLDGKVNVWDLTANRMKPLFQTRAAVTALAVDRTSLGGEPLVVGLSDGAVLSAGGGGEQEKASVATSDASLKPFYPSTLSNELLELGTRHSDVVTRCRVYKAGSEDVRILSCSLAGTIADGDRKISFSPNGCGAFDAVFLSSGELACGFSDGRLLIGTQSTTLTSGVCSLVSL